MSGPTRRWWGTDDRRRRPRRAPSVATDGWDEPLTPAVPVGEALSAVAAELGLGDHDSDAYVKVVAAWAALVGADGAAHSRPSSLHDGRLTIGVDDPAWAARLRFLETEIRASVNRSVGPGTVQRVVWKVVGEHGHNGR